MSQEDLVLWAADGFVLLSSIIMSIGVYGMLWMPDAYTRVHAASKSVFLGIIPLLIAATLAGGFEVLLKAILIAVFLLLTTPVAAHAIGQAAFLAGEPMETPGALDESGRGLPD